jgi:DNA-directed RNA polymerase subunit N (RpoN/RPB10)
MKRRTFLLLPVFAFSSMLSASEEKRCRVCGNIIGDREHFYQVKGSKEVVCERCFAEAPRCSVCKLPTASATLDPETGACSKCLAGLPRCLACGRPILGRGYRFSTSAGIFCADCKEHRHACDLCGVPVGNTFWQYPDGRIICNECGRRAIFDLRVVESIMRDVQKSVEKRLGLKIRAPYALKVETMSGIGPADGSGGMTAGAGREALFRGELGSFLINNGKPEIILLFGLPPDLLYEAGAHEYAHAWLAENAQAGLEVELQEGFAQWVAAEVLRDRGFSNVLAELEGRKDYPYGTGYQRLKTMQQKIILDLLQSKR